MNKCTRFFFKCGRLCQTENQLTMAWLFIYFFQNSTFLSFIKGNWTFFSKWKLPFSELVVKNINQVLTVFESINQTRYKCMVYIKPGNMFLCPLQIIWQINELCVRINLNKVAYFANVWSKVGGFVCQLSFFVLFINHLNVSN